MITRVKWHTWLGKKYLNSQNIKKRNKKMLTNHSEIMLDKTKFIHAAPPFFFGFVICYKLGQNEHVKVWNLWWASCQWPSVTCWRLPRLRLSYVQLNCNVKTDSSILSLGPRVHTVIAMHSGMHCTHSMLYIYQRQTYWQWAQTAPFGPGSALEHLSLMALHLGLAEQNTALKLNENFIWNKGRKIKFRQKFLH